jgi:uncharacterized protein YeaO (DUF488 family)
VTIELCRIYDLPRTTTGVRVLVDRLWPRGVRAADAPIDKWVKEVAPSSELRRWYRHDPKKWAEFKHRYFDELDQKQEIVAALLSLATSGDLVLVYGSRERKLNNASALKEYLDARVPDHAV